MTSCRLVFGHGEPEKEEGAPLQEPPSTSEDTAKYSTDGAEEPIDTYVVMLFCPWHLPGNDR